ncbi:MAG: hypothetical protein DRJ50_14410 [Actinobacteria bacterium]|nr:MAG: hypothetical protein DRJ50_14410 [Actinomycetota bacterium]
MLDMTAGLTANMGNNNQFLNAAGNAAQGSQTAGTGYLGAAGNTYGQAGSANAWEQNSADSYGSTGELAQRRISGDTIANDPATQAAIDRFQGSVAPMIQDAAGLSGLGDSSAVLNALSVGQSNMMLPLIQEAAAREERGLQGELSSAFGRGQGYGALGQNLGARGLAGAQGQFNIGEALGNRDARASQLFSSLQGQSHGQLMDQINQARTTGSMGRDMTQEGLDAQYNEFLRQSGLFEKSTFGPLDTISGMMGATAEGKK